MPTPDLTAAANHFSGSAYSEEEVVLRRAKADNLHERTNQLWRAAAVGATALTLVGATVAGNVLGWNEGSENQSAAAGLDVPAEVEQRIEENGMTNLGADHKAAEQQAAAEAHTTQ